MLIAATAAAGGSNIITGLILPFGAMAAIMYFLLIRPQQQQRKRHREMLDNLKKNDWVITSGGLIGRVTQIADDEVRLNLGDSEVRVVRAMIVDLRNKDGSARTPEKKTEEKKS
ncbi:MAG: preprotein translocase subunit YajC [Ponticaulis sp.]|nr:preprotein translocase subunit YajC [Ponticaulis sp.]|tara:strand:- start:38312 stop:38653 length:342 start_codon:yes stop_codon:yes gene_type:complete